jgi:hypothetical protein
VFSPIDTLLHSDLFTAVLDLRYIYIYVLSLDLYICSEFRSMCLKVRSIYSKFRSVFYEFRSEFMFICDQKILLSFIDLLSLCPFSV